MPPTPPAGYAVLGLDVSHHQGRIDWSRVAASGEVAFAYLKATESTSHVDTRFHGNWDTARAHGIPVGAYHYFSLCKSGSAQAAHFIATVPRADGSLPPAVDVEPDRSCNRPHRWSTAGHELADWLDAVQAHYGARPIVYTGSWFYRDHLAADGLDVHLWVPSYSREPRDLGSRWLFWQYTNRGRVPGIRGPVDRNVFIGTPADLLALTGAPRS